MARIPTASRNNVPTEQVEAFDEYVNERGSIPETGPLSVMLHVPELIKRGEHLRAYLRGGESSLPANIRELGMLVAAREMDCQFIWNAHAAMGRQSGLSDNLVDSLRDKLNGLSPAESAVIEYGCEFFRTHRVSLVDSLRDKKELNGLSPAESAVIEYGCEFFRTHRVSEAIFNDAMAQFGTRGLVELTTLMGYYACLAFNINAFDVGLPAEITEPPLPV